MHATLLSDPTLIAIGALAAGALLTWLMTRLYVREVSIKGVEHIDPVVAEKHRYLKRLEMELSVAEDLNQPAATLNDLSGRIATARKELEVAILNYEHGKSLSTKSPKTDKLRNIESPAPVFAAQVHWTPCAQERQLRTQDGTTQTK